MIIDKLDHIMFYEPLLKNLGAGLEAIKNLESHEVGKYNFEGGFFMVQEGETKPMEEGTFEAHRSYIDVQIILEGSEEIAWADITDLQTQTPYDPQKDAEHFNGEKSHHILISEGMFYAAFPHDGHKPVSHTKKKLQFKKIVMKLPV
jgi:YhcH/YjgK/YiaL family protein